MKKSAQVHKGLALSLSKGFTLVELLVVIAIIAILAAVVVLIINPLELTRRGRDAARLTDLANLQQAINVVVQEATNSGQNIACNGSATCVGHSVTGGTGGASAKRATDGTGWIGINLQLQTSVSVPTLPIDPVNSNTGGPTAGNAANKGYHYIYCGSGSDWEIFTVLESIAQSPRMKTDGGASGTSGWSDDFYEVGSVLTLGNAGTCIY